MAPRARSRGRHQSHVPRQAPSRRSLSALDAMAASSAPSMAVSRDPAAPADGPAVHSRAEAALAALISPRETAAPPVEKYPSSAGTGEGESEAPDSVGTGGLELSSRVARAAPAAVPPVGGSEGTAEGSRDGGVDGPQAKVVCFGDVNRALTQLQRGGGAICFVSNTALWSLFDGIVAATLECGVMP